MQNDKAMIIKEIESATSNDSTLQKVIELHKKFISTPGIDK